MTLSFELKLQNKSESTSVLTIMFDISAKLVGAFFVFVSRCFKECREGDILYFLCQLNFIDFCLAFDIYYCHN